MSEPILLQTGFSTTLMFISVILAILAVLAPLPDPPPLPVNGNWTDWYENITCSASCGGGDKILIRTCNNPAPSNGGIDCEGYTTKIVRCNTKPCPINGNWSNWVENTTCTVTCGGGTLQQIRFCDNPVPKYNGTYCVGNSSKSVICNTNHCEIHGGWADWYDVTDCTVTCNGGKKAQMRECTNPPPQYCGDDCPEKSYQVIDCNEDVCPIDGGWSGWGNDSPCSVTCGGGTYTQTRTCDNPAPSTTGQPCPESDTQSLICNTNPCPVNGNWGAWVDSAPCTVSCGEGTGAKVQMRTCDSPAPAYCGNDCVGSSYQVIPCTSTIPCPKCMTPAYTKDNKVNVCAFFIPQTVSWSEAKLACETVGAKLPEARSAKEDQDIYARKPLTTNVWLGLSDSVTDGKFVWNSDNSVPTYTNWKSGEPNGGTAQNCAIFSASADSWEDTDCTTKLTAMCELFFP